MSTATLDLVALKAALFAVSTEETRYYLNGVLVEVTPDSVTYVATDGHILFAHRGTAPEPNTLTGAWIIPADVIKGIKFNRIIKSFPLMTLTQADDRLSLALADGTSVGFRPIDGTFPNWRRVLPETTDGTLPSGVAFNPNLLAKLWKAGEVMGWNSPAIRYNGTGPALLSYGSPDGATFAVIMPMRNDTGATPMPLPTWAQFREHEAQAIAA